ncbi:hypothetical protein M9Y10_015050 [Tritrichomonas musculus]|uniref:Protein kinase domain-containing protein n=1 Tax=Tritrichomonas musculus TaxID=1915356 RepID=A0ABR2L180_9EUKA
MTSKVDTDLDISPWKVNPSDFQNEKDDKKQIKGGNGLVTFVIRKSDGLKCVKKKTLKSLKDIETRRNFNREVTILGTFKHPALVPLIGYYEKKQSGFIFLKAIEKGSLDENIKVNGTMTNPLWDETHKLIIAYGIACAMEYLHSQRVIHRDLKPANVLLDNQLFPFVSDFGTSKQVNPELSIQQTISSTTPVIMAPEFFEDPQETKDKLELDIYAYGITIYHLISGLEPFASYSLMSLMKAVSNEERPPIPDYVAPHWKELIENCWAQNPTDRPPFTDICDVLESDQFVTNSINKDLFNSYQKMVKPYRLGSEKTDKPKSKSESVSEPEPEPVAESEEPINTESPVLKNLREEFEKGGSVASKLTYADALFSGKYGSPNHEEAFKIFLSIANNDKNVNKDKALAEYFAGQCLVNQGKYPLASTYLNKAVYHGNSDAAFYLAEQIFDGNIKAKNSDQLKKLYQFAADAGHPQAIKKFAFMNYYGSFNNHPDRTTANKYFKIGSDNGDPELVYIWAVRNEFGRGCEKNVKEGMRLMKMAAEDLKYPEAQFDYALHLYNGLNVEKDLDEATKFFQMAASNNHPVAVLYCYLILSNSSDEEDRNSAQPFFDQCFSDEFMNENKTDPDAWAINGQMLSDSGDIDNALSNLFFAMTSGSIKAMHVLGNICENDPSRGDPDFFYEQAAHHCHCLDEYGFYTPMPYKVFHCTKCNKDICEGCAKHCHKGHNVIDAKTESGFKCECGAKGLNGKCSGEFVGQQCCLQHLYQCETCSKHNDLIFICKSCADKCHQNHQIIDCGIQKNFCSCGMKNFSNHFKCKILDFNETEQCSVLSFFDEPAMQRWFKCISCGIYATDEDGVCEKCANLCHKDHMIIDVGVQKRQCKCMIREKCHF